MKLSSKKNPALVLSGGGMKAAAFHIGVCLALRDKGFNFAGGTKKEVKAAKYPDSLTFKNYVGSSAGSVIATFLANGYCLDAIIDAFTQGEGLTDFTRKSDKKDIKKVLEPITYRKLFGISFKGASPARLLSSLFLSKKSFDGGIESLLKQRLKVTGFFDVKNIEAYIREQVSDGRSFKDLGVELSIISTHLDFAKKVVFGKGSEELSNKHIEYAGYASISEAVAASTAIPPVFSPFGITNDEGKELFFFDGEIRDTLSTHVAAEHGSDLVIASYSMAPYTFNSKIGSLNDFGIPAIINQALYQMIQQKIESFVDHRKNVADIVNSVKGYLKEIDVPEKQRKHLLQIILDKTGFQPDVEYIYIHPSEEDYKLFFADHFSLSTKVLKQIAESGFRSAMNILRKYNV